jgi:hypothetical protein
MARDQLASCSISEISIKTLNLGQRNGWEIAGRRRWFVKKTAMYIRCEMVWGAILP